MESALYRRNSQIEFLRFFMALIIVFFHKYEAIIPRGFLAVEFFFILTGYLMAKSLNKSNENDSNGSLVNYIGHKIGAFYPELIIALLMGFIYDLFSTCIVESNYRDFIVASLRNVLQNLALLRMTGIAGTWATCVPAWYLSSMIIALIILVPILRKHKQPFLYLTLALLLYKIPMHQLKGLEEESFADWVSFTYVGNIRAIAGILLGSVGYEVVKLSSNIKFSCLHRLIITILIPVLLTAFVAICFCKTGRFDAVAVCIHFVIVILVFSNLSYFNKVWKWRKLHICCCALGSLSLSLYLAHYLASPICSFLTKKQGDCFLLYPVTSIMLAFIVMVSAKAIRKHISHKVISFAKRLCSRKHGANQQGSRNEQWL